MLGNSSGFQSYQYRAVEFILGNKNEALLAVFASRPEAQAMLAATLQAPTVYDAFLRFLARRGHPVPQQVLERDVSQAWVETPELVAVYKAIYEDTTTYWSEYATCEDLVDLEDAFQFWRFRHLRTVQRTIGFKPGTGGSSGVSFLRRALDLTLLPRDLLGQDRARRLAGKCAPMDIDQVARLAGALTGVRRTGQPKGWPSGAITAGWSPVSSTTRTSSSGPISITAT